MNELISVITTCYNAGDFIRETIDSIFAQSYQNLEYIIVDDGSTDNTISEIEKFSDPRIRLIKAGRIGRGRALNLALENCRGGYVAVQDADDISHPERLRMELKTLRSTDGIVGSDQVVFHGGQSPVWNCYPEDPCDIKDVTDSLIYVNPLSHTSILFPKTLSDSVKGYSRTRKNLFDWDFYIRAAEKKFRLYRISVPLVGKRTHGEQFFERHNRLAYIYGSFKLQLRAGQVLNKRYRAAVSSLFIFGYRLLPANLRIGIRRLMNRQV